MKWNVSFVPRGSVDFDVEADTEDEAVAKAWTLFNEAEPVAEWDIEEATDYDEDPVCKVCDDTHRMWHNELDRLVPCTFCPTPCEKCRMTNKGAYCETTPCPCECHLWEPTDE